MGYTKLKLTKTERQYPYISLIDNATLKGLSHEKDFKNFDKNLQNLAYLRDAAGF
jgi:hypothetical protein